MDCQFSFGPNNAFFCKSDSIWAWSDNGTLPEPLRQILEDPHHPQANQFPYDVAFPMEHGMFSMAWKTVKGEDYYEELFLGPKYSKLADFIRQCAQGGGHTTRTVFGPNMSYFSISPDGFSWQHLPPVLEADIMGRMKKGVPTNVALGAHGSFVVLYNNGNVTFDVATHYPAVDAMIRDSAENGRRRGIAFIALNPHAAGQYYIAYGDGSASWNLPNEWSVDVTNVSRSLRPVGSVRAPLPSPGVATMGSTTAAGGTLPSFISPTDPAPEAPSATSMALQGLGKLWNVVQQQQQQSPQQNTFDANSFQVDTSGIDLSNLTNGFDPSSLASAFDPSSLTAALDPSALVANLDLANTVGSLFSDS